MARGCDDCLQRKDVIFVILFFFVIALATVSINQTVKAERLIYKELCNDYNNLNDNSKHDCLADRYGYIGGMFGMQSITVWMLVIVIFLVLSVKVLYSGGN